MTPISAWRYFVWSSWSKPTNDRIVYKTIKKTKPGSLIEIGLGDGVRCERMMRVAQKFSDGGKVRYTGLDRFEGRDENETPLKLIEMHKQLNNFGAKAKLVPGDFSDGIERIANSHVRTDLVVIDCGEEHDSCPSWRFLPRMLHPNSVVIVLFQNNEYEIMNFLDVEKKAAALSKPQKKQAAA